MQQFFKLFELRLEAHIRKNDGPVLARVRERIFKIQVALLHQIGYDARGGAGNARVAVNKHAAATVHGVLDESDGGGEVS